MGWNHRILAHEHNGGVYLQIHEVYYNKEGNPDGYTENPISVGSETVKGITWTLNKMLECRNKPILWAGEKFPNEYKIKYRCDLCGQNTFDSPSPHKCAGIFRKRGLLWSLNYLLTLKYNRNCDKFKNKMSKEAEEFFRQKTIEEAKKPRMKKFLALVNREKEGKIMQEYADQQLQLNIVSQRRELLLDFLSKINENLIAHPHLQMNSDFVDDYLKSNNCD